MLGSSMSVVLAAAIVAFVALASGVLLWDGLASGSFARGGSAVGRELRRARTEIVVGAAGFALALWVALGLLSRAH